GKGLGGYAYVVGVIVEEGLKETFRLFERSASGMGQTAFDQLSSAEAHHVAHLRNGDGRASCQGKHMVGGGGQVRAGINQRTVKVEHDAARHIVKNGHVMSFIRSRNVAGWKSAVFCGTRRTGRAS